MDYKKIREEAFKEAVLRLRLHNERKRYGDKLINPFIISNFMAGVDVVLEILKTKEKP